MMGSLVDDKSIWGVKVDSVGAARGDGRWNDVRFPEEVGKQRES